MKLAEPLEALEKLIDSGANAATVKNFISSLREQYEAAEREHAELANKHSKLCETHVNLQTEHQRLIGENRQAKADRHGEALMPEELSILRLLDKESGFVYAEDIPESLHIEIGRLRWLLGRLVKSQHVYETVNVPPRYQIDEKGRDAVHKPGT